MMCVGSFDYGMKKGEMIKFRGQWYVDELAKGAFTLASLSRLAEVFGDPVDGGRYEITVTVSEKDYEVVE